MAESIALAGDGDHGTTVLRVVDNMEAVVHQETSRNICTLLRDVGWSVMGVDGGASSALLGTFFSGMADAAIGLTSLDCHAFAAALGAGLRAIGTVSQAQVGDKTMLDALVPAVRAFRAAATLGENVSRALQDSAIAAQAGADTTREMIARIGRAKFLGDKTLGSPDAGAVSISLLFRGFYEALSNEGKG